MNDIDTLKPILEAVLLAAGEPLSLDRLQSIFGHDDSQERPSKAEIKQVLEAIAQDYAERPLGLKEIATGFCFQVRQEYAQWVSQLWQEKPPRYSRAVMETLAIIAYRQPITRAEIEDIRGVAVSSQIVKTLLEREWIQIIGERETPGRPSLYATTPQFLDYFNLKSLEELPTLMQLQAIPMEGNEAIIENLIPSSLTDDISLDPQSVADDPSEDIAMQAEEMAMEDDSAEHSLNSSVDDAESEEVAEVDIISSPKENSDESRFDSIDEEAAAQKL